LRKDTTSENLAQVTCDLESVRKENTALVEEIEGLNWKIQELTEMEHELTQLQTKMFEVLFL